MYCTTNSYFAAFPDIVDKLGNSVHIPYLLSSHHLGEFFHRFHLLSSPLAAALLDYLLEVESLVLDLFDCNTASLVSAVLCQSSLP